MIQARLAERAWTGTLCNERRERSLSKCNTLDAPDQDYSYIEEHGMKAGIAGTAIAGTATVPPNFRLSSRPPPRIVSPAL